MTTQRTVSRRKSLGQGMTEYIIIVALIAVAAIGVYSYFGKTVRHQTAGMTQELAGKDSKESVKKAGDAAKAATEQADKNKDLSNYGEGNRTK